jgi:tetratricopeptide (TPR) repeat protein
MAQAKLSLGLLDQANAFLGDLERYHPAFLNTGLVRIQAAFAANDPSTALRLSNELVKRTNTAVPNADSTVQMIQDVRIKAISSRGVAQLGLRRYAEARADLQEVLRVSPRSSAAMVNLAKVHIAERNLPEAYSLYERALNGDPRNFDAISGIVNIAIRQGQQAKAHARLDSLIDANAGRGDVLAALHFLKSNVYSTEKNPTQTEKFLLSAISMDPDYLSAYSAYASFLVAQNRVSEALDQYRKVVEKRPVAPALTMLGILEDSQNNTAEAEKAYRRALELSPNTPIAANNLAWLIAEKQGNLDEALQLATLAVSKGQTTAGFYDTLGWVYLKKGLASPAVEQFRKAVAIEDTTAQKTGIAPTPGYRVRLGMALAKSGDKDSARREVETSLRQIANLSPREVQDAKAVLANL